MDDSERGTPALRPGSGRGPRSHRRGDRRHGKARAARTALSSRRPGGPLAEVASATGAQGPELERDHPHAKGRDQRSHFENAQPQRYFVENLPKAYHYGAVGAVADTGLPEEAFQSTCPFDLDGLLDIGFLPYRSPHQLRQNPR